MPYILKTDTDISKLSTDAALSLIYDLTAAMVAQDYIKAEQVILELAKIIKGE